MSPAEVPISTMLQWVRDLARPGRRVLLGIAGAPGSGKSTLGQLLVDALPGEAVLVGMDGYHFAQEELARLGNAERKGAPDTFDVLGYTQLLTRLRARDEPVVYAPRFNRDLEEPIGSAVPVAQDVPIVITEGNYLLLDSPGWSAVTGLLDACWFVDPGEEVRLERLIARHIGHGRSPEAARERSTGTDQRNADLVTASRGRASRVVRVPTLVIPEPVGIPEKR
jgi:pantothenate kinase